MKNNRSRSKKTLRALAWGVRPQTIPKIMRLLPLSAICIVASCSRLHVSHPNSYADLSHERRAIHAYLEMQYFAEEMDWVARQLEEWGTLGISAPVVIQNDGQFAFDPKVTAEALYKENRTEGAVSLRRSIATNVALNVDAKNLLNNIIEDLTAIDEADNPKARTSLKSGIVNAVRELTGISGGQAALTGLASGRPKLLALLESVLGASNTEEGDAPSTNAPAASDEANTGAPSDTGSGSAVANGSGSDALAKPANTAAEVVGLFSKPLGTFDSSGLASINPRRRIRLTASDFWELNLHKFFSLPDKLVGKSVPVFIAFTVSCRPGWRTSSDFAGVVETRVEYMYENARGEMIPLARHVADESILPVAGIYPAYDSQELNLRNSRRELRTFTAQLAANGQLAAASLFLESADKVELDAETNTGLATVTGYSSSGQGFGYEFRPTFRALGDPGNRKTKSGFRLEPISFPAVAVALVDVKLLRYRLRAMVEADLENVHTEARKQQKGEIRKRLSRNIALVESLVEQAEQRVLAGLAEGVREAMNDKDFHALVDKTAAAIANDLVDDELQAKSLVKKETDKRLDRIQLVFQTSHTWRPLNKPFAANLPPFDLLGRLMQPRLPESSFANRLAALAQAFEHFDKTFCTNFSYDHGVMEDRLTNQYACESLRARWAMLGSQALNFDARTKIKRQDFDSAN